MGCLSEGVTLQHTYLFWQNSGHHYLSWVVEPDVIDQLESLKQTYMQHFKRRFARKTKEIF